MRICFIGDIVALAGRRIIENILPEFLRTNNIDICIANAENAANGLGVSNKICDALFKVGVDCITLGNHTFSNHDFLYHIDHYDNVVRPSNVSDKWPGKDYAIITKGNNKLGVINLEGQVDIAPIGCDPYGKADELIDVLKSQGVNSIFIDFHAEATSEKNAFGYHCAGRASVVAGTHTHVQTADNRILKGYTGFITDAGMTGCYESVIGMDIDCSLKRLKDKLPGRYEAAVGDALMCGVIADIEEDGRCSSITRFCEYE